MSDSLSHGWQCPSCDRRIPRTVEVCRCGTERKRLEELGFSFEAPLPPATSHRPAPQPVEYHGPMGMLTGYRIDTALSTGLRVTLRAIFVVAVIGVGAAMARTAYAPPRPVRSNVQILTTLDAFSLRAGATGNTIPAFLDSAGIAGAISPTGAPDDPVRAIDDVELRRGFCSPSPALLIRHEYPGYYDRWSDEKLESIALEKHPEYANRLCTVSTRLDAAPDEIVKYVLLPRTLLGHAWAAMQTALVMMALALMLMNVYYRVIVGRAVVG